MIAATWGRSDPPILGADAALPAQLTGRDGCAALPARTRSYPVGGRRRATSTLRSRASPRFNSRPSSNNLPHSVMPWGTVWVGPDGAPRPSPRDGDLKNPVLSVRHGWPVMLVSL